MRPPLPSSVRCASCAALQASRNPRRLGAPHCFVHPEKVPHGCRAWLPRSASASALRSASSSWGADFIDRKTPSIREPLPPCGLAMTFDPARGLQLKKVLG